MILEYVLFYHNAVDVVGTAVQPEFAERESHAKERDFDMRDVVEVQAGKREQFEVFVTAHVPNGELVRLRLERPYHETLESLGDILRGTHVFEVLDDFFGSLHAAEHDVRAAGESLLVAGGERVAPYLRGELFRAQHLAHTVGENLGTGAWNGAESCRLENVKQLV